METYFSKKAVLLSWPHFKAEAERCQLANQRSSFRRAKSERATQPDGATLLATLSLPCKNSIFSNELRLAGFKRVKSKFELVSKPIKS